MNTNYLNDLKATAENLSNSLQSVLAMAHTAIKQVEKDDPQKAHELLRDLEEAQQAKDLNTVNNLMKKYANSNTK
jgi:NAD-dependent SIR2 family protein deacetylase